MPQAPEADVTRLRRAVPRPVRTPWRGPRSLRHPAYRRVWSAALVSFSARFIEGTVTAWVVVQNTDSPLAVTLLGFFRFLPFLFAGPFAGLISDRLPRLRLVRATELGSACAAVIVATLALGGWLEVWHLYLYSLVTGTLLVLAWPARRAYMMGVVGRRNMTPALALDMLGWTISNIVASNIAGNLLRVVAPGYLYAWLAVSAMFSLALLRGLPALWRPTPAEEREPALRSLAEGFRYVRRSRLLVGAVMVVAVTNLSGFLFELVTPVFAKEVLHTGPAGLGLLISAPSFGALAIGLLLTGLGTRVSRPGLWLLIAGIGQHVVTIAWSYATWFPASFGALVVTGLFTFTFATMNSNTFLAATPDSMRGRVQGVQIFVIGTFPVSSLLVGVLANAIGPAPAVRWMAVGGTAALLLIWLLFPELRRPIEPPREAASAA